MAQPQLIVKFYPDIPMKEALRQVEALLGQSASRVAPLFPGDSDPELATLLEVALKRGTSATTVAKQLSAMRGVEYAHPPEHRATR